MSLSIQELEGQALVTEAAVQAFLEGRSFPLVEGPSITFVYHGAADQVRLQHWIYGLESSQPFHRLHGTNLWYLVLEIPAESRVEYKLELRQGGVQQLILDPLNPNVAHDPFGSNSVCHTAGYSPPDWTREDPEARPGAVEEFTLYSEAFQEPRRVLLYLPARFRRERRYPLLIVHDGEDFLRYAGLQTVLDNLVHRLEIPPMIVALTQSSRRLVEYAHHESHARFLTEDLVPRLEAAFPLVARPEARGLLGSSFGAVAALSTAWQHPGFYGRLALLSGSFAFTDVGDNRRGPRFEPVVQFVNAFRRRPIRLTEQLYVACGIYEALIYENRSLVPLLQSTGMEVRYAESRDGHNWENWRDRLREALSWLFPGPLWMVYE